MADPHNPMYQNACIVQKKQHSSQKGVHVESGMPFWATFDFEDFANPPPSQPRPIPVPNHKLGG